MGIFLRKVFAWQRRRARARGIRDAWCWAVTFVFSEWDRIFKNPMTTAAAIDRLVHHSVILEFAVPSFRSEKATGDKAAATKGDNPKAAPDNYPSRADNYSKAAKAKAK